MNDFFKAISDTFGGIMKTLATPPSQRGQAVAGQVQVPMVDANGNPIPMQPQMMQNPQMIQQPGMQQSIPQGQYIQQPIAQQAVPQGQYIQQPGMQQPIPQ